MDSLLTRTCSILTTTPTRWQELVRSVSLELLSREPVPGEWSVLACLQHLVDTESVFQFRVDAFLQGKDFPAFNPFIQACGLWQTYFTSQVISR